VTLGDAAPELVAVIPAVAAGALLTVIADTMIPRCSRRPAPPTGLITTVGPLVAFAIDVGGG
jgi:ZIP family zinc transporter